MILSSNSTFRKHSGQDRNLYYIFFYNINYLFTPFLLLKGGFKR
jgi:hypothetical protein